MTNQDNVKRIGVLVDLSYTLKQAGEEFEKFGNNCLQQIVTGAQRCQSRHDVLYANLRRLYNREPRRELAIRIIIS